MRLRRMLLRLLRKFMRAQMISLAMSNGRRLMSMCGKVV